MNYLWMDAETTGLDANKNDIVQFACIPVINGVRQKPFNQFCQPLNFDAVDPGAVAVHGITVEQMRTFQSPIDMLDDLIQYLNSFGVKFVIAGFNVPFDKGFLSAMFIKHGRSDDFFRLFTLDAHDTFRRAKKVKAQLPLSDLKLATLANHFGVEIDAHEALSDISATIEVDKCIGAMLGESESDYITAVQQDIVLGRPLKEPAQLHVHSMYGMVDSVPTLDQWEDWCLKNNAPGFSVVDHGSAVSLFGAIRTKKVKAIPGVGLYIRFDNEPGYHTLNAWAVSNEGYFNLMKLASMGFKNAETEEGTQLTIPVVPVEEVLKHRAGLKFGTACINNAAGKAILQTHNFENAEGWLLKYVEAFGEDLFVEFNPVDITCVYSDKIGFQPITKGGITPDGNIQKTYNLFLAEMVDKHNLKAVPVSNAHFISPEDKMIQDCISKNSCKDGRYYHQSYHALNATDMFKGLKRHLGDWMTEDKFDQWSQNTIDILEQAKTIAIKFDYHLPKIDIPEHIKAKTDNYDQQTYYFMMERIKAHGRWQDDPVYVERFKKELDVIMKNATLNFIPYFLVYEDISTFARSQGILQNIARGSAGGSLLSYYLKIIHVDPIKADLPFERFLSHARIRAGSFPDIDMDIGDKARPLVMDYLRTKYGLGFAQISTFSKMKTKNAIKDVMFALYGKNRNDPEVKAICDTIPDSPQGVDELDFLYGHTDKEGVEHLGQMQTNEHLANFFKQHSEVEKIVRRMIGIVRGWSRHASAFVIATMDLASNRVPTLVMQDAKIGDMLVTQYDASMVEKSNLVKADILGIKTLTSVSDCIDLVRKHSGIDFLEEDNNGVALIYRLPEDEDVYADFYNKDTDSSFQFNTNLIKGYIQQFIPTERKHLSAMTALCRPGALDAEWEPGVSAAQYYMDVRNGTRTMDFIHEDLRPILEHSNGVFVYQEEVMKFLVEIAGYTLEESDQIRNAIAKKKHEVMMAAFDKIREGTKKRGWSSEQTEKVNGHIMAFSRYSFNKSHSHAYAELGYITMYLKHHHKLEWWASVLNGEDDEDKLRHYVAYLGKTITPPSLKNPSKLFTVVGDKIVAPVGVVKGVGDSVVNELVSKGPFRDLKDYIAKVNHSKVNIGAVGALIKARAADDLMDLSLPYPEARKKFMDEYRAIRKTKSEFKPELLELDPISVFLHERQSNQCFNKHLLSDPDVIQLIRETWPGLKQTGKKAIPFMMSDIPVLNDLKVAEGLMKKGVEQEVGMIMLFESSNVRKGVSKKGKPYSLTSVRLSDGYSAMEASMWDREKPFRWPVNSVVFVIGKLKEGFRSPVSLTVSEIEKVEKS